ncbi:hypothetical protein ACFE04_027369 [Oxalis oulophora]
MIEPIVGPREWKKSGRPVVYPTSDRTMPSRPRKNRVKDPLEQLEDRKMSKRDPISGRRTLNPGTPLERVVDMNAGIYRPPPVVSRRPVASQPTTASQQTAASRPQFTPHPQSFTSTSSLAPAPLPISHDGFKRSIVLCIPSKGGVTASQIRGKITKTTKG